MSENLARWKNPKDVMKMHTMRKGRRANPKSGNVETKKTFRIFRDSHSVTNTHGTGKRKNPFSCQFASSKRKRIRDENNGHSPKKVLVETNQNLFNVLSPKKNLFKHQQTQKNIEVKSDENLLCENVVFQNTNDRTDDKCDLLQVLPIDWSLKVKARVTSSSSLAWCTQVKTLEEAQGVTAHVHCTDQFISGEEKVAFLSYCHHWVHPNLPWLPVFPRIVSDVRISTSSMSLPSEIQCALHKDWMASFSSVFHQLRSEMCPYFYMCTHQFTVLFCAPGVHGESMSALLSPTTRGFREALHNEGILFTMPNLDKSQKDSPGCRDPDKLADITEEDTHNICLQSPDDDGICPDDDGISPDDDCDVLHTDEGASVWLESMGLDKKHFPSLDPGKVKLQREGFRQVDSRPQSLVFVEGDQVQALFNFLLNCRTCTATSGPQAGLPPTLLSPVAFRGATLKPNMVRWSSSKMINSSGLKKEQHILEICGPLLPHHVLNLTALLRRTQNTDVSFTFKTHETSAAFNVKHAGCLEKSGLHADVCRCLEKSCLHTDVRSCLEKSGLHADLRGCLAGSEGLQQMKAIKEATCSKHGFSYTV
ncbi:protein downstream neighbor of Son-like [Gigantopelta aegis]|uniref:protein downstream neighbor of Son-like n=1 Tax=Gigantopelta aegis TaxID=1735272 RepID=UPI001B889F0B|nr:protein downstream neighbor of Son-like [Gigantopelta aegis]